MKGDSYERFFNIGILYTGCYGRNLFCRWACRIIRRKGAVIVDGIGNLISMLDYVLDTKRKRHITGGILLSVSLLFGGLALTVMTIKSEEDEENE